MFHFQRLNAGIIDCDAVACYDRIIPSVASIAETNAGAPEEVPITFAKTLKEMKDHMSTAKVISEQYKRNTEDSLKYGFGQGATDSPTKWNLMDNIIAKAYNKKAKGCILKDPTKTVVKKQFSGRYLWVSGGLLDLNKTKYTMMIWSFLPDKTPILQKENELQPNVAHIDAADGMKLLLQRADVAKGQRMLG
eukprot:6367134-Ditylum_brightwellii.AAC.1